MERLITVLHECEAFRVTGEQAGGLFFLHCDVFQHSFKTVKEIKKVVVQLKTQLEDTLGYTLPFYSYTQNPRWCKIIGWTYLTKYEAEGKEYEVWTWELKQ